MTEEDAKKLWCPMTKIQDTHVAYNRRTYDDHEDFGEHKDTPNKSQCCWGSSCAMWAWNSGSTIEGYCGLRGKVVIP